MTLWKSIYLKSKLMSKEPLQSNLIFIYSRNLVTQGIGSWLEGVLFGDQTYWQIDDEKTKWICAADVLDSDTTKRPDLQFMR